MWINHNLISCKHLILVDASQPKYITTVLSIKRRKRESAEPLEFDWIYTGTNEMILNRDLTILWLDIYREHLFIEN